MTTPAWLIEHFSMERLPVEGTWFVRTWRSPQDTADGGPAGSAIVALYVDDPSDPNGASCSMFHRLTFDEVWHFYDGDPIRLVLLHPDATSEDVVLGRDLAAGQRVQFTIPAGTWQAGVLVDGGEWALFGCTMAPGFTAGCFEGGTRTALLTSHPARAADIGRLGVDEDEPTEMPVGPSNS